MSIALTTIRKCVQNVVTWFVYEFRYPNSYELYKIVLFAEKKNRISSFEKKKSI